MNIRICAPSYKRPEGVLTLKYLPFLKVYVAPEEYKDYRRSNPGAEIVRCAKGIQGNVARVRNHILDQEFEAGADVVVITDDDLKGVYYWEGNRKHLVQTEELPFVIEKFTVMARDFKAYLWGFNLYQDKQIYQEMSPFTTLSPILGPFTAHLRGTEIRYDERFLLKEDYDLWLQHIYRYRITLRSQKYFYVCKQSEQAGGCAAQRNMKREREQFALLQKKWGSQIVKRDINPRSHNLKKKKVREDYNPVLYVPIKGV
jgi:hypothetical protein